MALSPDPPRPRLRCREPSRSHARPCRLRSDQDVRVHHGQAPLSRSGFAAGPVLLCAEQILALSNSSGRLLGLVDTARPPRSVAAVSLSCPWRTAFSARSPAVPFAFSTPARPCPEVTDSVPLLCLRGRWRSRPPAGRSPTVSRAFYEPLLVAHRSPHVIGPPSFRAPHALQTRRSRPLRVVPSFCDTPRMRKIAIIGAAVSSSHATSRRPVLVHELHARCRSRSTTSMPSASTRRRGRAPVGGAGRRRIPRHRARRPGAGVRGRRLPDQRDPGGDTGRPSPTSRSGAVRTATDDADTIGIGGIMRGLRTMR